MNLEEAKELGCPDYLLKKLKDLGVVSFSSPHNVTSVDWAKFEDGIDFLFRNHVGDDEDFNKILNRFEILDL